jgi:hypothetical protein
MPKTTYANEMNIPVVAKARRKFIHEFFGEVDLRILEIGALDNPIFRKDEGGVYFADFFTQEELRLAHQNNPARMSSNIVPVDYVLRGRTLSQAVTQRVDLTIASHVIEHVPDVIGWLGEIHSVSRYLYLSVPDRRHTFDYFKPCTDAVDWIRWHDEKLDKPSYYQILRHLYYHASLKHGDSWAANIPDDHLLRFTMRDAMRSARELSETYTDVHCSIFTADSFRRIFRDLRDTGLVPWSIAAISDVQQGDNEFRVILEAE